VTGGGATPLPGAGLRLAHIQALLLLFCLAAFLPGFATLPPTDRDESRFVQATRQMLVSGDFIDIRFQEQARHKKPVGIYWLQAAAVTAAGGPETAGLWAYRLPSLAGAVIAVLATAWMGARLFGPGPALLAGLLLASSIVLTVEAHLAKTDAALLGAVMLAQAALLRAWLDRDEPQPSRHGTAALFWGAVGVAILLKGPIVLLVSGGTAALLAAMARRGRWLLRLRPRPWLLLTVALVAPWLAAITWKTGGAFFAEAVGHDLLGKVATGQESHGAPPGFYLATLPLAFWPGILLVPAALPWVWAHRRAPAVLFCLAWILPTWLLFEAVPTKLLHYTLPALPALALLTAAAAPTWRERRRWLVGTGFFLWLLPALALPAAVILAAPLLEGRWDLLPLLAAAGVLLLTAATLRFLGTRRLAHGLTAALAAALLAKGALLGLVLPRSPSLWLGPQLAAAAKQAAPCPTTVLASAGYREPSLVFTAGTETRLTDGAGAAAHLLADPACALASVDERAAPAFAAALAAAGGAAEEVTRVSGINTVRGRRQTLTLYRLKSRP
jgi:4-amino-4-deoxy-L-arabinose transferase-like glycosyltransferase